MNFATSSANCCVWDVEETTFREQDAGRHAINTSANLVSSLMVSYHFTVNYPIIRIIRRQALEEKL